MMITQSQQGRASLGQFIKICDACRRTTSFHKLHRRPPCTACPVHEFLDDLPVVSKLEIRTLSREDKELVRHSFTLLEPHLEQFALALYDTLFARHPHIKVMFEGPQEEQSKKLAAMLSTMIRGLDRLENIKPAVRALGRRHIDYGVRPMDYTIFWNALLDTLETFLKDEFDNETRNAWMTFYRHMTSMMLSTTKWQEPIDRYGRRVA